MEGENALRFGGSVQAAQGGATSVPGSTIIAHTQYGANRAALKANDNRVGGSTQVVGAAAEMLRNRVNGNLQCKKDSPAPTGGRDAAGGNKEHQCRRVWPGILA